MPKETIYVEVTRTKKEPKHGAGNCKCLVCPNCKVTELEDCNLPMSEWRCQIRAFKVDGLSHCLKCNNWF